jgi:beta-glucosidase
MKFRLGLFDRPYVDQPRRAHCRSGADETRIAGDLARRSLVLVENNGILPLAAGGRCVAVIGPGADSARELLGDYAHLLHMETLREIAVEGTRSARSPMRS